MSTISPYTGDGSNREFDITFNYRNADSIRVSVDGVDVGFTFVSESRVKTDEVPYVGAEVQVYRKTDVSSNEKVFSDGTVIFGADLNDAVSQPRERCEELESTVDDNYKRSFKVPPGESAFDLPSSVNRASKFLAFDSEGNAFPSAGTGADAGLREDLAGDSGAALVGFKANDTDSVKRDLRERMVDVAVSLDDFKLAVETEYSAAFTRALAALSARGGGVLMLPRGTIQVASAAIGTAGLQIPSSTVIQGQGSPSSRIEVTGTTICNLFTATDRSGITLRGFTAVGNQQGVGTYNTGAFVDFVLSAGAVADSSDFFIEDVHAEKFKAPWITAIRSANTTYKIRRVRVDGFTYKSYSGDSLGEDNVAINNAALVIKGPDDGTGGVDQIDIRNIDIRADYIKTGVILYHAITNARLSNIRAVQAGKAGNFIDDRGCYALQVYDYNGTGSNVTIDGFELSGRSCGIYATNLEDLRIYNGRLSGHTDTVDATLPKGALVLNGNRRFHVRNVRFMTNVRDVSIVGPSGGTARVDGVLENLSTDGTAGVSLKVRTVAGVPLDGLKIDRCRFVAGQSPNYGAALYVDGDEIINDLEVRNSYFSGSAYAFDAYVLATLSPSTNWLFDSTEFVSTTRGLRCRSISGRVQLRRCKGTSGTSGKTFEMTSCTNLHAADLESTTGSGGTSFDFTSCQGTLLGDFRHLGGTTKVTGLGTAKPTHTGKLGEFVQHLSPAVPAYVDGTTPTAYTVGWRNNGTTWMDARETVMV